MLRAMLRTDGDGWTPADDLSRVSQGRGRPDGLAWVEVDVSDAASGDVQSLVDQFGLDPLAVEDALNPRQRPKFERYEGHAFLVMYQLDEVDDQLEARQIACFLGERFLLVMHCGADRMVAAARKRVESLDDEARRADRLLHALLDTVVDDYEVVAGRLETDVEHLEATALRVARKTSMSARTLGDMPSQVMLYSLKQQVSLMRRFGLPLGTVLERIEWSKDRQGDTDTEELFRDVHDHVLRIAAQARSVEELAGAVLDLTRGVQADVLNEVNKKLTAWAAIIAVPTFIASIYGTNYRLLPSPDLGAVGFVYVLCIMAGAAAALWLFFKRRRWI